MNKQEVSEVDWKSPNLRSTLVAHFRGQQTAQATIQTRFFFTNVTPGKLILLKNLILSVGLLHNESQCELIYTNGSVTFALSPLRKNHIFNKRESCKCALNFPADAVPKLSYFLISYLFYQQTTVVKYMWVIVFTFKMYVCFYNI